MKKLQAGVAELKRLVVNTKQDRLILSKSRGTCFVSSIEHTKKGGKATPNAKGHSVFPGRGNVSPIGCVASTIAKATQQSHPGTNSHLKKVDMNFCTACGYYIKGTQCTLRGI